jgi:hypothetical protein
MEMAILIGTKMQIKNVKWLSIPAAEAEVEITDGEFTCVAFSCPCEVDVNDKLYEPLHVFNIRNAMLVDNAAPGIWNLTDNGLGRKVIGELTDISKQLLKVGGIVLVVDEYLPGGLATGNLVEFECARIDLW